MSGSGGVPPPPDRSIFEDISTAALAFGRELRACIAPLLADQPSIRELALALGLDKSIAWKLHHIATACDALPILTALPGQAGMAKVMRAIANTGTDIAALDHARVALAKAIHRHGLAHAELKSLATRQDGDSAARGGMRHIHKRAYEANAAVHGVSIQGTAVAIMLLPGGAAEHVTVVASTLLHRLRRTLNTGPTPIYYQMQRSGHSAATDTARGHASRLQSTPCLVRALCSPEVLDSHLTHVGVGGGHAICYEPPPDSPSRVDLAFREIDHGTLASRGIDATGRGETVVSLFLPTQHVLVDLMIHSSMPVSDLQHDLYLSNAPTRAHAQGPELLRHAIALDTRSDPGKALPPPFAAAGERWAALLEGSATAVQTPMPDLRTYRIMAHYPPTPSRIRVRWTWQSR